MNLSQVFEGLTEDRFCTGVFACNDAGEMVDARNGGASKWCVEGWMSKTDQPREVRGRVDEVARECGHFNAADANDALGYEFVRILRQEGGK